MIVERKQIILLATILLFMSASIFASPALCVDKKIPSKEAEPRKTPSSSVVDLEKLFSNDKDSKDDPTFINSQSLTLKQQERLFEYAGAVEVRRGDMLMRSDFLDGKYNEDNQIEEITARNNVIITKGDSLKATCQKAIYNAKTKTVSLMENPELEQNGSVLAADVIKVFLDENRSVAEGQVRVKVQNAKGLQGDANKDKK
ncbi:MAG: hypothetical protein GYA55_12340 [SAR324 cluster bacterium]|uniref:Organic solvent tolerance-like N-terminal domain-containing protein n=1 Tax=SAR324 cluster bacterium TaxID=2024889 RepID=A0A7X9IKC0_9DELT|nr:hypothetical protein [SAR324 cluster bacterium]